MSKCITMAYTTTYLAPLEDAHLRDFAILAQNGLTDLQERYPFIINSFRASQDEYLEWMLKLSLINQLSLSRLHGHGHWVPGALGHPPMWKVRYNGPMPMALEEEEKEGDMEVEETPIDYLQRLLLEEIYPYLRAMNSVTYVLQ
jgi:hypothetical protein